MTKIKRYSTVTPTASDIVIGTDKENQELTKNFKIGDILDLLNSLNGNEVIAYTFVESPIGELDENGSGYFISENNLTNPADVTKLIFSKKLKSGNDLSDLFNFIDAHKSSFKLQIRNISDPNNIVYFDINEITEEDFQFSVSVSVYNTDFYIGELEYSKIYSVYWDYSVGSGGGESNKLTGNAIDLSNPLVNYYNMDDADNHSYSNYTISDLANGGKARLLVTTSLLPTITGATNIKGDEFQPNTPIYLEVENSGGRIEYWVKQIYINAFIDITALPFGGKYYESPTPLTEFAGTPSILKTSTGRLLLGTDYWQYANTTSNTTGMYEYIGNTFVKIADIVNMFWAQFFEYSGVIYLIGVDKWKTGNIMISKSTDFGSTWTDPVKIVDKLTGQGWQTSACSLLIKDGHIVKPVLDSGTPVITGDTYRIAFIIANLSTDVTVAANWTTSNIMPFNKTLIPIKISTQANGIVNPYNPTNTHSKFVLEPNAIEVAGQVRLLCRLEVQPNSNYAMYYTVAWNSGSPKLSTINATPNYIEMYGGNVKFKVLYDSVSAKYISIVNPCKYKYMNDFRTESHLITSSDCITWTLKNRVAGYDVTNNWEAIIAQYGIQYADFIIDGNDLLVSYRVADANAATFHDSNITSLMKIPNFRSIPDETFASGNISLLINENSERFETADGIGVIKDQSKYYNSPFMLNVNNSIKPNWVSGGIQFNEAEYLRVVHNEYLNINNGFSIFAVVENLQNTFNRIVSKSSGSGGSDLQVNNYSFSFVGGLSVENGYGQYADYSIGNNYILSASYDNVNNDIYNYLNGANRGTPSSLSNATFVTNRVHLTTAYTTGNTAEMWIGARQVPTTGKLNGKIKALHIFPSYMNPTQMLAYINSLNAIYNIY